MAIKDLQNIGSTELRITKEIERLESMVKVNRKRERDTYSKMFFANKSQQQGGGGESVTDYVQKKFKKEETQFKTVED